MEYTSGKEDFLAFGVFPCPAFFFLPPFRAGLAFAGLTFPGLAAAVPAGSASASVEGVS